MEYYANLTKVHFWGFSKDINFRKIIATKVAQAPVVPICWRNALGGIFLYFMYSFIDERYYKFEISKDHEYLMLFGKFNCRADHQRTFSNFANTMGDADVIMADFLDKKVYHPFRFLKSIPLFFVWLFQMLAKGMPLLEALNAIRFVELCYIQKKELSSYFDKKYKFVVAYYDASPDESFIIQEFKNRGVLTMTLQHGIFARKSKIRSITDTAFEISESVSDYYLAWNQYTRDEAIKIGLNPENVIVLGAPKYISFKEPDSACFSDSNVFGVILNNSAFDLHNRKLIEAANNISKEMNMKYYLRYHPQMKGSEYKDLYNENFIAVNNNKTTIAQYAQTVNFTIISSSSVFVDLLLLKHPTYRLKVLEDDTYSTVEYNSFSTASQLKEMHNNRKADNPAFDYLCNSYNTYKNYRTFFDQKLSSDNSDCK